MNVNFTTDGFESRHRFDAWRDAVCSSLINAQAYQVEKNEFSGSFTYGTLTDVGLAQHTAQASLLWQRTYDCIRNFPDNDFYLGYITKGDGHLEQNESMSTLKGGDFVIYDAARPFKFTMNNMAINVIRLPRTVFDRKSPGIAKMAGSKLDMRRPGMFAMQQLISEAFNWDPFEESTYYATQFSEALIDMIAVCINMQKREEPRRNDLYRQMVNYIKRNLDKPDFSVATLASEYFVSSRTVNRIFATHNSTPMNMLRAERLAACRKILIEGRARSITQVAMDHGFNDMSHFSMAFRKEFGCSPTSLMACTV